MSYSEKIEITGSSEKVWAYYADVSSWKSWDAEVKEVFLDNGLNILSSGILHPKNGPKAKIQVVKCEINSHFTVQSKLPLCVMSFQHRIMEKNNNVIVEHSVDFSGVLAPLFSFVIGRQIKKTLPNTLQGLKAAVEKGL